jgi:hypothetical protein
MIVSSIGRYTNYLLITAPFYNVGLVTQARLILTRKYTNYTNYLLITAPFYNVGLVTQARLILTRKYINISDVKNIGMPV